MNRSIMKKVILFKDFLKLLNDGLSVECTDGLNDLINIYNKQEIVIEDSFCGYIARLGDGSFDEIIPEDETGDDTTNLIHGSIFHAGKGGMLRLDEKPDYSGIL